MARRNLKEWNKKYYTIEGTSLRISQMTKSKIAKGTITLKNLAKVVAERNPLALKGLFTDAKKEFTRIAELPQVRTSDDLLQAIRTAYRSSLYSVDKGRLLAENMKEIVPQIMTTEEMEDMMVTLNITNLNFDDWNWNEALKRMESPDGQYWIKIESAGKSKGYIGKSIHYGRI